MKALVKARDTEKVVFFAGEAAAYLSAGHSTRAGSLIV
jgi:hypothetical protein